MYSRRIPIVTAFVEVTGSIVENKWELIPAL
jgi:hypothetical protein